jgi:hypothetical protein
MKENILDFGKTYSVSLAVLGITTQMDVDTLLSRILVCSTIMWTLMRAWNEYTKRGNYCSSATHCRNRKIASK